MQIIVIMESRFLARSALLLCISLTTILAQNSDPLDPPLDPDDACFYQGKFNPMRTTCQLVKWYTLPYIEPIIQVFGATFSKLCNDWLN